GGRYDRTLPPAALLDLPRSPTSAFPNEPFAAPGATERALAAAKARAGRWLRGEVEATAAGYRVKLVLEGPAGPIDEREVRDVELPRAARAASMALAGGGALGARAEIDPGVADWLGASRVGELLAWQTLEEDEAGGLLTPQGACRDVERLAAEVGPFGPLARIECALVAEERAPLAALPVDGSTPGRLARTSRYHRVSGGRTDPRALAADLRRAFAGASEPLGRAVLAGAESEMWLAGGEPDKARERGLVAVQSEPRSPLAWKALMNASVGEPGFGPIVRAHAGWHPDAPWGWRRLAEQPDANDPGATLASRRLKFARRAHQLVPHNVSFTYALGEQLVRSGEREEVRALAAPLLSGDQDERVAGETLMVLVDASVARFAAAYARGLRALEGGDALSGDGLRGELFRRTMALASLLGRREELADALVRRFFEPEPRLDRVGASPVVGAALCAAVRRPLAARCFERLERLVAERHFWMLLPSTLAALEGGKLFANGAYAKAAAAWRPIAGEENPATELLREPMAEAFERAGDATMAEIVDRPALAEAEMLHGATAAHVRAARRAAKRGDRDEARALASVVANAWATADVPPAALREMQGLAGVRP
ncbi:MAG TPA: hypothetical protein VFS00_20230, partial [Polyangiaceae bacterium]|nr:hypothetical protein [Polyangiaceae bacterium]